eukprot:31772-Pleurochrysis_carterae.AAC.4
MEWLSASLHRVACCKAKYADVHSLTPTLGVGHAKSSEKCFRKEVQQTHVLRVKPPMVCRVDMRPVRLRLPYHNRNNSVFQTRTLLFGKTEMSSVLYGLACAEFRIPAKNLPAAPDPSHQANEDACLQPGRVYTHSKKKNTLDSPYPACVCALAFPLQLRRALPSMNV